MASAFIPNDAYEVGEAEVTLVGLITPESGLASIDYASGRGGTPRRWFFETTKTLEMLTRAEKQAVTEADRDQAVTDRAFKIATRSRRPVQ